MRSLVERIECGMTTWEDAWLVASLVKRLARYEQVLRDIAVQGDAGAGRKACQALVNAPSPPVHLPLGDGACGPEARAPRDLERARGGGR